MAALAADGRARAAALVVALGAQVTDVLARVVAPGARVALVDFPAHPNVGDSAIWLGELAALRRLGVAIGYTAHLGSFSEAGLRAAGRIDAILLHGGGNFGDVWPRYQMQRERIVAAFPELPIVQLPQTIHFRDATARERARAAFSAHPRFTLLARDAVSAETARTELGVRTEQCPDPAFCLGPLEATVRPRHDIVALGRTDVEQRADLGQLGDAAVCQDWLSEPRSPVPWWQAPLEHATGRYPNRLAILRPLLTGAYASAARARVERGRRLLSLGRVVVTDRLHAHVLSLLLGIPHVLLDNTYGKNRQFYSTWTRESPVTAWADTPAEALAIARDLLAPARPLAR